MKVNYNLLAIVLCLFYVTFDRFASSVSHSVLTLLGGVGVFQLFLSLYSWKQKGNDILSPYIFFLFALYVFSLGQCLLYPFGLVSEKRNLEGFLGITEEDIFKSSIVSLLMLLFFHLGALFAQKKHFRSRISNVGRRFYDSDLVKLRRVGFFFFLISFFPYMSDTINDMFTSLEMGYGSTYGIGRIGVDNINALVAAFFIPSIICLFISHKDNRLIRSIILVFMFLLVFVILLIGRRSYAVILLCLLIVLYNFFVKRFSRKMLFLGTICVFFFLQVLAYVADTRAHGRSFSDNVEVSDNAAVDAVAEMGLTQMCLIKSMEHVPDKEPYRYGKSFFYSFTTLIPNLGFWAIHPARREANMSEWLTNKLEVNFGTGFSMCAEAWINFGYFGILLFFFWGVVLGRLFGSIETFISNEEFNKVAFILIIFWFCLVLPRNSFISIIRGLFYYAIPIYLLCNNFKYRKHGKD